MGMNPIQKFGYGNLAGLALIAITVMLGTTLISVGQGVSGANSAVMETICSVFTTIKDVIFILGLALMVLGGAIYAGANLMPSQSRGAFQGYGMAMVIGGIIGVAIAVAAPFILNTIVGASGAGGQILTSGVSDQGGSSAAQGAASICADYASQSTG
jgi:hypothetical protein